MYQSRPAVYDDFVMSVFVDTLSHSIDDNGQPSVNSLEVGVSQYRPKRVSAHTLI